MTGARWSVLAAYSRALVGVDLLCRDGLPRSELKPDVIVEGDSEPTGLRLDSIQSISLLLIL